MKIGTQSGKSVQSVYNNLSFRTSLTYPNNREITFTPDDLNRITHITQDAQHIAQYAYAGPYRVTGRTYLNGTSLTIDYDGGRRVISYTHSGSIGTFGYTYDKEDNKKYENRSFGSKGDAYMYDAIYRLTGVKYGVPNLNPASTYDDYTTFDSKKIYGLDGVGNRISVTNGTTINYTTNNLNQYEQIDSATLDYDNNGNLISGTANTYIYDYANRLLKVTRTSDDQILAEYKYDALGRRFWKNAWDDSQYVETYFYYDGPRCIEERNASDVMIAQYVFGNGIDEVLTMDRNSETYYYHENSLGSIYAVTTATGTVAERYTYDAYGNVSFYDGSGSPIANSLISNHLLFTGRRYDPETGLYFYRARYYSAEIGRFLNRDPAEDDSLLNLYAYVGNNPINYVDPFGEVVEPENIRSKSAIIREVRDAFNKSNAMFESLWRTQIPRMLRLAISKKTKARLQNLFNLGSLGMQFFPGGTENSRHNRFVYTMNKGWIDLGHFFLSAFGVGVFGGEKQSYRAGWLVEEYLQGILERMGVKNEWAKSAYTIEDLPSDKLGAEFGTEKLKSEKVEDIAKNFEKFLNEHGGVDWVQPEPDKPIPDKAKDLYGKDPNKIPSDLPGFRLWGKGWYLWRDAMEGLGKNYSDRPVPTPSHKNLKDCR
ncbi:RHS repeat domain-containing protein [Planctomycetota bacterium]